MTLPGPWSAGQLGVVDELVVTATAGADEKDLIFLAETPAPRVRPVCGRTGRPGIRTDRVSPIRKAEGSFAYAFLPSSSVSITGSVRKMIMKYMLDNMNGYMIESM
jgi:hypothetical protein